MLTSHGAVRACSLNVDIGTDYIIDILVFVQKLTIFPHSFRFISRVYTPFYEVEIYIIVGGVIKKRVIF
jgi:hypothetical protein